MSLPCENWKSIRFPWDRRLYSKNNANRTPAVVVFIQEPESPGRQISWRACHTHLSSSPLARDSHRHAFKKPLHAVDACGPFTRTASLLARGARSAAVLAGDLAIVASVP